MTQPVEPRFEVGDAVKRERGAGTVFASTTFGKVVGAIRGEGMDAVAVVWDNQEYFADSSGPVVDLQFVIPGVLDDQLEKM